MQAYQETTLWADGTKANHTYLLDGDQMWAYLPVNSLEPRYFAKPIRISRSGRRFTPVNPGPFRLPVGTQDPTTVTVSGSNGAVYTLDLAAKTCTCPGYTFRGACKHVTELSTA
jgi:hypothetical protein